MTTALKSDDCHKNTQKPDDCTATQPTANSGLVIVQLKNQVRYILPSVRELHSRESRPHHELRKMKRLAKNCEFYKTVAFVLEQSLVC